jgi:hypothetical protein
MLNQIVINNLVLILTCIEREVPIPDSLINDTKKLAGLLEEMPKDKLKRLEAILDRLPSTKERGGR